MPNTLPQNRIFPGLQNQVWEGFVSGCTYRWEHDAKSGYGAPYVWRGESYDIPYRLGYADDEGCVVRTEVEQTMAWCLASRHHNGFVRERALRQLLGCGEYPFVVPYLLRPLSEYVFPIYDLLYARRHQLPQAAVRNFLGQNPEFVDLARQRMCSYWNAYYRRKVSDFEQMPNVRLMEWLERPISV